MSFQGTSQSLSGAVDLLDFHNGVLTSHSIYLPFKCSQVPARGVGLTVCVYVCADPLSLLQMGDCGCSVEIPPTFGSLSLRNN